MLWLATLITGTTTRNPSPDRRDAAPAPARLPRWIDRTVAVLSAAGTAIADYRTRRAATRELNRLSERMLHDIGLTRDDIPRVVREMTERRSRAATSARTAPPARSARSTSEDCCAGA